jgi:hypothetical protein
MPNTPVAIVSGAATVADVGGDLVGSSFIQRVKLDIGASGASTPILAGQRDPELSLSIVPASAAYFNVGASVAGNVAASVAGHVLVSADGHVLVSGDGTFNTAIVNVSGSIPASVAGHVLVSGDGTFLVREQGIASAAATAQGGGYLVMGVDGASVARFMLTDTVGRQISVVSGGNIVASVQGNVAASVAGHVLVSGDGTFNAAIVNVSGTVPVSVNNVVNVSAVGGVINVSAQGGVMTVSARNQVDVSAHGVVSAAGRVVTYFALPASFITDGAQSEIRTVVNVSGASAGNYALVSAPASGVTRVTRLMLTFTSATFVTFRGASAASSSINYTGPMRVLDGGSITLDKSDSPWFVTTGAKNFSVNVSAGVGIAGAVWSY